MTVNDFNDRLKLVKVKDTEVLFRSTDGTTFNVAGMYYGVKAEDNTIAHPQVGDEPNCVIIQVAPNA